MGGCRPDIQSNDLRVNLRDTFLLYGVTLVFLLSSCSPAAPLDGTTLPDQSPSPSTTLATPTSALWVRYEASEPGVGFDYPAAYDQVGCGPDLIRVSDNTYDLRLGHRIHLLIEPSDASEVQSLGDEWIRILRGDQTVQITNTSSTELGGQPALRVEYRSGGTGRFAESTFVLYKGFSYRLDFSAGEFCDLPAQGISEGQVFEHMRDTLSFTGSK